VRRYTDRTHWAALLCVRALPGEPSMPLPKQKISKRRRDFRRSHHALTMPTLSPCPRCRQPRIPHRVCPNCGYYHGREVVVTE
jgi:large subunit ribosomal protein L32